METKKFTRKPFHVEAVRVTAEDMKEIADWCGGKVVDRPNPRDKSQDQYYIKVDVERPQTEKQTMAFVGNWILKMGRGFKVYTDAGLRKTFEEVDPLILEKNAPTMPNNFAKFIGGKKSTIVPSSN